MQYDGNFRFRVWMSDNEEVTVYIMLCMVALESIARVVDSIRMRFGALEAK